MLNARCARKMSPEVGDECAKVMEAFAGTYHMQGMGLCMGAWCCWTDRPGSPSPPDRRAPTAGPVVGPGCDGGAYGALGDVDRAFAWYEKGLEERAPNMVYMKVGAPWDPARGDPRFQALMRRMNYPG